MSRKDRKKDSEYWAELAHEPMEAKRLAPEVIDRLIAEGKISCYKKKKKE